ncbi:MAG: hypothetical protein WBM57_12390, partial [Woeseiaceae bacterium]
MIRKFVGAALAAALLVASHVAAADIDRQRELFKSVYETVERGDWSPVDGLSAPDQQLLQQYVLWPDLRATWLRANLGKVPAAEVDEFLKSYGTLRPVRELRYQQALYFAETGDLGSYQKIYEQFYQGKDIARLDCLSLQAEINAGRFKRVNQRALDLWLVGTSQVDECDPVFKYLNEKQLLGLDEYRQRFDLAITAREFQLARWLAKKIDQRHIDEAALWIGAQSNPEKFLAGHTPDRDSKTYRKQLAYAAERLTYSDPVAALRLWTGVASQYAFSRKLQRDTERHIALWTARDGLPGGYRLLAALPRAAQDDEVMRWRARLSLRDNEWQRLLVDVASMTTAESAQQEWRYWRAVALESLGRAQEARQEFESLSAERSYYGFLAADEIGRDYALDDD